MPGANSPDRCNRMDKILIGKVANAVGLRGEIKVFPYSETKERFEELTTVYLGDEACRIEAVRYQKNLVVLKLSGIDDRAAAEQVKGQDVSIGAEELKELPADTYYVRDMIGLYVVDEAGAPLGHLTDVIKNTAQDLYEVETADGRKILIPAVEEFILRIDMDNNRITVRLIEGLLDI